MTRKGEVPGYNFLLRGPGPGWEQADLSWWIPEGQVRRPCPAVTAEEAGSPAPSWLSGSSAALRVPQAATLANGHCHQVSGAGTGRGSPLPQHPVMAPEPCRTQPPDCSLGPPGSPTAPSLGELEGGGRRPVSVSVYLVLSLTTTSRLTVGWIGH